MDGLTPDVPRLIAMSISRALVRRVGKAKTSVKQEAQMTYSRNSKPIIDVAIAGQVLATLSCKFDVMAQGCSLLEKAAWTALDVLRPVILAAWQSLPSCLCQDSRFLQHVLQLVAFIWPLLCVVAG
jgi:hypothetical protein